MVAAFLRWGYDRLSRRTLDRQTQASSERVACAFLRDSAVHWYTNALNVNYVGFNRLRNLQARKNNVDFLRSCFLVGGKSDIICQGRLGTARRESFECIEVRVLQFYYGKIGLMIGAPPSQADCCAWYVSGTLLGTDETILSNTPTTPIISCPPEPVLVRVHSEGADLEQTT
jgi:hypothetical protein